MEQAIDHLNRENEEGLELIQPTGTVIKATDGAMASLPAEEQDSLRELALEIETVLRSPEAGTALAFDAIEAQSLEAMQKVALWSLLPSDVRSDLKREGDVRRKQAA